MNMILIMFFLLHLTSNSDSENNKQQIEFPSTSEIASHAFNLVKAGKITYKNTTFTLYNLFIGRIDHVLNLAENSTSITIRTSADCNLEYQYSDLDHITNYFQVVAIHLNSIGEPSIIDPSIIDLPCTHDRNYLNNNHVIYKKDIEFMPDFTTLHNQRDQILQIMKELFQTKKIKLYNQVFTMDQLNYENISLVEYLNPKINRVVISMTGKCDIKIKISEDQTWIMAQLFIYLRPDMTVEKIYSSFHKGTGVNC